MSPLFNRHIELIELVNESKTQRSHEENSLVLRGFREALDLLKISHCTLCDMHYIEQGINRPMCCGVFLDWDVSADWKPTKIRKEDLMTIVEFIEGVDCQWLVPEDGNGYFVKDDMIAFNIDVFEAVRENEIPDSVTHITWSNK